MCLCDHASPPTPLPGPGISSSMSFEEEEEEEEENSSSSSQLNSNTRPSSATSRKSTRVSEELLLSRRADSSVAQVGGERSEVRQSWLSWATGWAQVPVKSFFPWSSSGLPVFSQARGRGLWSWTARLLRACLFPPSPVGLILGITTWYPVMPFSPPRSPPPSSHTHLSLLFPHLRAGTTSALTELNLSHSYL